MEKDIVDKNLYEILNQNIDVPMSFSNTILNFKYEKKHKTNNRYFKLAMAFSIMIISINLAVYAVILSKNYRASKSIGYISETLEDAIENSYIQYVDMEYAYSNNLGVKIDYIVMSDYNLNILFNFDISNIDIGEREAYISDLLIYDENKNIIFCYNEKEYKNFCKKNKVQYKKNDEERQYTNGYGIQLIELTENMNKTLYTLRALKEYPKTQKLYIQFKTIYFDETNKVNGNWNLEINLDKQFFERQSINYQILDPIEDISLVAARATDTTMRITYKLNNLDINKIGKIDMYIEDDLGNRYDMNNIEDIISVYKDEISATFNLNNRKNLEKFILYISFNNDKYIPITFYKK